MGLELKSFFIPSEAPQGDYFPIHVTWLSDEPVSIYVEFPEGVEVKEVYNVRPEDASLQDRRLMIRRVESEGYLGMVFKSKVLDDPEACLEVSVKLVNSKCEKVLRGPIRLFRPDVVVLSIPSSVRVIHGGVSDTIKVANLGKGTALLYLAVHGDSDVLLIEPEELAEFLDAFLGYLERKFPSLCEEFPHYREPLMKVLGFFKKLRSGGYSTEEAVAELKEAAEGLGRALSEDRRFMESFRDVFIGAYMASVQTLTVIGSFVEYLRSVAARKILIVNPLARLKVPRGGGRLRASLAITDLVYNKYNPVPLNIEFLSESETEIPLYSLFTFE